MEDHPRPSLNGHAGGANDEPVDDCDQVEVAPLFMPMPTAQTPTQPTPASHRPWLAYHFCIPSWCGPTSTPLELRVAIAMAPRVARLIKPREYVHIEAQGREDDGIRGEWLVLEELPMEKRALVESRIAAMIFKNNQS